MDLFGIFFYVFCFFVFSFILTCNFIFSIFQVESYAPASYHPRTHGDECHSHCQEQKATGKMMTRMVSFRLRLCGSLVHRTKYGRAMTSPIPNTSHHHVLIAEPSRGAAGAPCLTVCLIQPATAFFFFVVLSYCIQLCHPTVFRMDLFASER
jgi:hypothetical protein